ncbi:MAG: hypothetical protein ORN54_04140 [Cyclobacteriaceae bacterium]|nr:hypothetical protein [Cyclobacteriaceae bacterium]
MRHEFVLTWDRYMNYGVTASIVGAVLVFLYHKFRVLQLKSYKDKYDYVNLHEVRYFWYSILGLIFAIAFYANTLATERILTKGYIWFGICIFITICFVLIFYFIFYSMVKIYYLRSVERKLLKLRNTPRISPEGNIMRKLDETEEDAHLEVDKITEEENVHSVDYDVWLDDKTGYKKIEKYDSYLHAVECSECGFFTLKIDKEEIEVKPTVDELGLLLKHYKCSYCGHREAREVKIARLSSNVV